MHFFAHWPPFPCSYCLKFAESYTSATAPNHGVESAALKSYKQAPLPSAITHSFVTQTVPLCSKWPGMGYAFRQKPVFLLIPIHVPLPLRSPRVLAAIGVGVAAAAGAASYMLTRRKPTAEEMERERRDLLALSGRITDGTIMDTMVMEAQGADFSVPETITAPGGAGPTPDLIVYNYRIAGVTYECAQDVTSLAEYVHGIRTDLPIQVRYAPHNPANSIVVAETWSGLRLNSSHPYQAD
jgi:hypothetical protein